MQFGLDGSKGHATRRWTQAATAEDRRSWELMPLTALVAEGQAKGQTAQIPPPAPVT
jgi:hypothetical protein